MSYGLPRKIRFAFILQAVLGSLFLTIGLLVAVLAVRQYVILERMGTEAERFWEAYAQDPDTPLPNMTTMTGYLDRPGAPDPRLPAVLRNARTGVHWLPMMMRTKPQRTLYVDRQPQGTFYLSWDTWRIDRAIVLTGFVALLLSLATTLLISWLTYRVSGRLVAPVSWLADVVSRWDPRDPDADALDPGNLPPDSGHEVRQLSSALADLAYRVGDAVERERDFTRDASHELRTPLTVIRMATDMMIDDPGISARSLRSLGRVQRASRDMEAVLDAFLILAREAEIAPQSAQFDALDVVREEVERARPLLLDKPITLQVHEEGSPKLFAPPHVLNVMLRNLLVNAVTFTERGEIEVCVAADRIAVRDTGIGMSPETLAKAFDPFYRADLTREEGKGMGLSIVRRLGERFGWPVTLTSTPDEGTTAIIHFEP
ncbi:MAG: HAMP domain-containing histidine kinase [Lysobacter sp.]|nr:HAMP domain-containing histidine kinase [Lysobacter sp.]MDQ3269954.1 HAMP domain-containing histidine kinase [Pseudomonadota bacterium]